MRFINLICRIYVCVFLTEDQCSLQAVEAVPCRGTAGGREVVAPWSAFIYIPTLPLAKPIPSGYLGENTLWRTGRKIIQINPFSLSFKLHRNIKLHFDLIYLCSFCFTLLCNWGDNLSPKYTLHFHLFNFLSLFPYLSYWRALWQRVILIPLCFE